VLLLKFRSLKARGVRPAWAKCACPSHFNFKWKDKHYRIGQTEVCHLWNLVADETREGDVYRKLLEKLEEARKALGGQVFDVLGKLQFERHALHDLLIEAIRYGDQPEVRARLTTVLDHALDRGQLQDLLGDPRHGCAAINIGHDPLASFCALASVGMRRKALELVEPVEDDPQFDRARLPS